MIPFDVLEKGLSAMINAPYPSRLKWMIWYQPLFPQVDDLVKTNKVTL